jgi:hypothetical protein
MQLDVTTKRLFIGWYQIGKDSDDPLMRFFSFYLCLNVLMARLSGKEQDREMKEWVKNHTSILNEAYQIAKPNDSFQLRIGELIAQCPVERMMGRQPERSTMIDLNDFGGLVDVLYRIRCNLFHGNKDVMDQRDAKLVELAALILDCWMGCVKGLISQNHPCKQ